MSELVRQAKKAGVSARYLLFGSWFAFPSTITKVCDEGIDVICMLKALPKIMYEYRGRKLNLTGLYDAVKKRRGKAKILASLIVTLGVNAAGESVQAKIVFVRDRNREEQFEQIFNHFVASLPQLFRGLLGISLCES